MCGMYMKKCRSAYFLSFSIPLNKVPEEPHKLGSVYFNNKLLHAGFDQGVDEIMFEYTHVYLNFWLS